MARSYKYNNDHFQHLYLILKHILSKRMQLLKKLDTLVHKLRNKLNYFCKLYNNFISIKYQYHFMRILNLPVYFSGRNFRTPKFYLTFFWSEFTFTQI